MCWNNSLYKRLLISKIVDLCPPPWILFVFLFICLAEKSVALYFNRPMFTSFIWSYILCTVKGYLKRHFYKYLLYTYVSMFSVSFSNYCFFSFYLYVRKDLKYKTVPLIMTLFLKTCHILIYHIWGVKFSTPYLFS